MYFFNSLDDLEADLVEVIEFAVREFCLFEATGVPLLLTSELVDCWLSLRGRIKPREYSNDDNEEREEKKEHNMRNKQYNIHYKCRVCVCGSGRHHYNSKQYMLYVQCKAGLSPG